jgi:DNA-binding response OmpR family regulator
VLLLGECAAGLDAAALAELGVTLVPTSLDALASTVAEPDVASVVIAGPSPGTGADLALVNRVRRLTDLPILVVIEASRLSDRVVAFALGGSDVLAAPYDAEELLIRVRTLVERIPAPMSAVASTAPDAGTPSIVIDLTAREVLVGGRPVRLANREFELLAYLADHPRRAFTREELLQAVWGSSAQWQDPATVTEHIRRIRSHLAQFDGASGVVRTVRGHGYRFEPGAAAPPVAAAAVGDPLA